MTDHGLVSGHLEFDRELRAQGIKPIFGCELYHGTKNKFEGTERDQHHLITGAITDEGLKNLWRLVDKAATYFRYVGRVNWNMLKEFNEGLFVTSACIQGLVPQDAMVGEYGALNRYLDLFGERFFIEIHTYPGEEHEKLNQRLVEIARERGVGLVYATDAHFASPNQYEVHDTYLLMKGETIDTPIEERKMYHPKSLYIQSEEEVRTNLAYLPRSAVDEAIENSVIIGEMCNAKIPDAVDHRPVFITESCPWLKNPKHDSNEVFVDLVEKGIIERYGEDNQEAWKRVEFELQVLLDANLADYFLLSWDLMQYCKHANITVGPGRGSSAGCIVAYALGITDVDPLKYGLYFERFYNPGRAGGLPDIDSDFPREARRKIIDYLSNRWGESRVRVIGNVSRMTPKAALDRFWAKCGVTFEEKEDIKKIVLVAVPDINILDYKQIGWSRKVDSGKVQYIMDAAGEEIERYILSKPEPRQDRLRHWLDLVAIVCNRVENYGIHASGVIISDTDLAIEAPKRWVPDKKMFVTQFPMIEIEKRNLMKLDILGLRTLDTLQDWKNQMKERYDMDIDWSGLEDEMGDLESVWKFLDKGLARGVFQIEKGFAADFAKNMRPRSIIDLAIAGSIIRPGPNMFMDTYLKRRNGEEPVEYDDPFLEDIVQDTLGIFLFQEQVIEYFRKLGYTLTEADEIRRILGKKQPVDLQKVKSGEGIWKGRDYHSIADPILGYEQAEKIWNNLERFAAYSFNKCCHSKTYVTLSNGERIHISRAYHLQPKEIMSMWEDGTIAPHKVHKIICVGKKEMIEIRTKGKRVFRGTPEHRLLTTEGYKSIQEMEIGTELITQPRPVTDKQRIARSTNMKVLANRPERKQQDQRAAERMKIWQAERGYDAQVAHIKKVHENHPEIVTNLRAVSILAHERLKWLHAYDPEWRASFMRASIAATRATYNTGPGYGHCSIASNGMWCASKPERKMCEWLIEQGIEFEIHKVLPTGRICDFYFDGMYWEMDGMDRTYAYFEEKYGNLPFKVVTPEDFKFVVKRYLEIDHVSNGDPVISIKPCGKSMAYDIEMDPSGPLNFIANKVVSHNSHAVCYALIGFRTMFMKLWAAEAILALIRTNEKTKGEYIAEGRRMGIQVLPPDIIRSGIDTQIDGTEILYGLSNVKGVGKPAARLLIEIRERGFDVKSPEAINAALDILDTEWKALRDQAANSKSPFRVLSPRTRLKRNQIDALYYAGAFDNYLDTGFTLQEKQKYESEYLDIILSDNSQEIFANNQDILAECDEYSIFDNMPPNCDKVILPGIITHIRETQTRKSPHKKMAIIKIEYEGDEVEFVVFPQHWKAYKFLWTERTPGIFTLKKTDRGINFEEGMKLS